MKYHPEGLYVWDTWYLYHRKQTHLFHLQTKRPGSTRPDEDQYTIGHAISDDLLHWEELPTTLYRGSPGTYDDGALFTGYATEHENTIFLFYCSNHQDETGVKHQAMCLATSEDGINFARHPDNPIIQPDGYKYEIRDCRDLVVLKNPEGEGWLGYVVMRLVEEKLFHSCCIVLCRSKDLVHWEVGDPVFKPNRYRTFEVPDVFPLDGRWYMINLTGDHYDQRNRWSDPNVRHGIIVAEAGSPDGPFIEVRDNVLLAANDWQGFSARTVEVSGERLLFYTHDEGDGTRPVLGSLSWPVKLVPRQGGGLLPGYWRGIDHAFNQAKITPPVDLSLGDGWEIKPVGDFPMDNRGSMVCATIQLHTVKSAGIVIRHRKVSPGGDRDEGYLALLDPINREVALVKLPFFQPLQKIRWDIQPDGKYNFRIVAIDGFIEVYVDDVLALQCYDTSIDKGAVALFVEEGGASLSDIEYRSVKGDKK